MLRLDQLYFRLFSSLFVVTLFISAILGYFILKNNEINNHKTMLLNLIDQFSLMDNSKLPLEKITKATSARITIINLDGRVLFESSRDIKGMQNHLNRPEIVESLNKGVGFSIRHSSSVGADYLYVSKKFEDRYIRMAYKLDSIKAKFFNFWIKALFLVTFVMLLAFWLALKMNKRIGIDLENIKISLDNLLNKKYETLSGSVKCCKEFESISKRIDKVTLKLQKRDVQKDRYTKKLKLHTKKQADIISAISHEFKNPVAAIMGYAQTVKEDPDLSLQIRDRFLDKVTKNAQKISFMIDKLSMAVKLDNNTFVPEYSTFKLSSLLGEIKDTLLQKYKDREIILDIEDITIKADRSMFDNLLINLIDNALKYSEDEVIIIVKDGKLEVIDKGIGIEEEDITNITKRFFRVELLSWDNSMGVGLYIVKYILKLHNCTLMIESTPLKGSKFWFSIKDLEISS